MNTRLIVSGLLGAAVLGLPAAAKPAQATDDLSEWIDGPVRYVSRKDEVKTFRALETLEDRALFIVKFWRRRDPTPDTLVNERRQLFWERVQEANNNFLDSPKPGWMTDRGKIHILYGPPTETQEDLHLATGGLPSAGRGLIRWIYEGRPSERMDLDPIVVVPFVRDASGEYRLSYDPDLSSVFFDASAISEKRFASMDRFFETTSRGFGQSELSVMLDLGRMQEVPPQEQVLIEEVETKEAYDTHPLTADVNRYVDRERRVPIVALTVDLSDSQGRDKPAIIARFEPVDATRETRLLGEESFRVEEREGVRVAQARIALDPGDYTVTVLVADPNEARTSLSREDLRVQPPGERLRFSDVICAAELQSVPYASMSGYREPFIVGPFKVLPKLDATFRPGESIRVFYEVYGAAAPMRITYQLEGQEADGSWVALGRPAVGEQSEISQGWELQTAARWPVGNYRIRIDVEDGEGRMISTEVPFRLSGAEPS